MRVAAGGWTAFCFRESADAQGHCGTSPPGDQRTPRARFGGSRKVHLARFIDPELPFTEGEIRRALRLVCSAAEAKEVAREIAQLPAEAAHGMAAAEEARARGSTASEEINPPSWNVSDEIFALLACVSGSAAKRVDRLMERRWREWTESSLRAQIRQHRVTNEAP